MFGRKKQWRVAESATQAAEVAETQPGVVSDRGRISGNPITCREGEGLSDNLEATAIRRADAAAGEARRRKDEAVSATDGGNWYKYAAVDLKRLTNFGEALALSG